MNLGAVGWRQFASMYVVVSVLYYHADASDHN